jgi:hypothetical protein
LNWSYLDQRSKKSKGEKMNTKNITEFECQDCHAKLGVGQVMMDGKLLLTSVIPAFCPLCGRSDLKAIGGQNEPEQKSENRKLATQLCWTLDNMPALPVEHIQPIASFITKIQQDAPEYIGACMLFELGRAYEITMRTPPVDKPASEKTANSEKKAE